MRTILVSVVVFVGLLLAACGAGGAAPGGPVIVLDASHACATTRDVVHVLDQRLRRAQLGRAEIDAEHPRRVRCLLNRDVSVADARDLVVLLSGRGDMQFRIVAKDPETGMEGEKRGALADMYRVPPNRAWLPGPDGGDVLLEIPEQGAERALQGAIDADADASRIEELRRALAEVRARDVFGGADIVESRAEPGGQQRSEFVTYFRMSSDRADAFHDFTARNVKRQVAIVVNGVVQAMPVIRSPLLGEGVLEGRGSFGHSRAAAAVLAAILSDDLLLPAPLELLRIDAPAVPTRDDPK